MPAKVAKQQRRGKNNKRHSNKHSHNQNHKKKSLHMDKSSKLKKSKMINGHQTSDFDGSFEMKHTQNEIQNDRSNTDVKIPKNSNSNSNLNSSINEPLKQTKDDKDKIELLQRRRLHGFYLGEEFMSKHNFEMARVYFEQSLNRNIDNEILPELPNELDIYCKLLICRMHCDNSNINLSKALQEVNYILTKIPNSVQHYIIKAELNIRKNNFENVGKCLLRAAEYDQPNVLNSVYLYFHQISENTNQNNNIGNNYITAVSPIKCDIDKLCKFFEELTLISQQNILSIEWDEIIDGINNCDDIILPLFKDKKNNSEDILAFKKFLIKTLEWNLPQNDKQQSLIFLKVEFAYILARELWNLFPILSISSFLNNLDASIRNCIPTMEDAIPIDCLPTYFLENGLFGCRDGYDFISASIFEPSICLSSIFDIIFSNKKFIISHSWLYKSGIKLIYWLSSTSIYHINSETILSIINDITDLEWNKFISTRINAHYAIDPELNETVLSRDAHEDGKKFENAMEKIVGKEKKNYLMQLELDLSIPILKKYASIMSEISGIDEDILIYELTLPDEENKEDVVLTCSLLKEYLNNPKFKNYKPVGLPVLVQNAEFNICNNSSYNKKNILLQLSLLEKEVIQFQIDYKNKVYKIAGNKATELDKVMSTLQYRGLELTKWLRNFVKYMIARRDIEQEIVNVSNKNNHKDAMNWFELMTNYLNGANNILLKIISKLFINNLIKSYNKYENENNNNNNNNNNDDMKYEKYEIYPGKKIEKISSRYFELDCMAKFYHSIKKQFENLGILNEKFENINQIKKCINNKLLNENNKDILYFKNILLSSLNISCIKIPILEIAIPATIIENQYCNVYKNWIRYPLTQTYVEKTKLFIERCKYLRDNIACIIYSSVEKRCLLYPTLHTSPNKYFKCIGCQKIYAQLLCKNCNLAHYCSIQCQHQHWERFHKRECKKYANLSSPTIIINW